MYGVNLQFIQDAVRQADEESAQRTLRDITCRPKRLDNPIPEMHLTTEEIKTLQERADCSNEDSTELEASELVWRRAKWLRDNEPHPTPCLPRDCERGEGLLRVLGLNNQHRRGMNAGTDY